MGAGLKRAFAGFKTVKVKARGQEVTHIQVEPGKWEIKPEKDKYKL